MVCVKMVVVGLSFCWRGRRKWIYSIQLRAEAEIICPNKILA